jgi:porin
MPYVESIGPSKKRKRALARAAGFRFPRLMPVTRQSFLPRVLPLAGSRFCTHTMPTRVTQKGRKWLSAFVLALAGLGSIGLHADSPAPPAPAFAAPTPAPGFWEQTYLLGDFHGGRTALENEGVVFTATYTGETFSNPVGGVSRASIYEGLVDLELTLDFQKMAEWDGTFHVSGYYPMGNGITGEATHDLFLVSGIDAYDTPHVFELWYEQRALGDKVSLRVGQLAADKEFVISNGAANFLSSTYGLPAVIFANAPTPSYAYGGLGVRLQADPDEHWRLLTGVFQGNPAPDRNGDPNPNRAPAHEFNNNGLAFDINGSDGVFNINEIWYKVNQEKNATGLPGTFKIGGWLHSGTFADKRYDNRGEPLASVDSDGHARAVDGNHGFYLVADQTLWQDNSDANNPRNIGVFFRAGNAVADRSTFNYYFDGGFAFNGPFPGRGGDVCGIATAYGHVGSGARSFVEDENNEDTANRPLPDFEENIEATYYAQISPWLSVQPDLQVILHPGASAAVANAVVFGVRTTISF